MGWESKLFCKNEIGPLEIGKLADLAALEEDFPEINADKINEKSNPFWFCRTGKSVHDTGIYKGL